MSGDVQPRKRKDKRRKKEDIPIGEDVGSSSYSSDETIHIYKDRGTGGNICAKIVFFLLLGALAVMVGLIVTEYRGSSDDTPVAESRWAQVFDGWVDESPPKHEEHDEPVEESGEHDEEHSEETEEPGNDGQDGLEEVGSQEEQSQEEEEEIESEEAQSPEEEEEEEEESEEGQEEEEEERQEEDKEEVEEEEEEEKEEEEEEEEESSEEILEGIPGVTESDEDDQDEEEGDESAGAEGGDDFSEEAKPEEGEEEEARRKSTVAPVTETSPKLPVHAPSQAGETLNKKSQGFQQSEDRPVTVVSKGRKEAPDKEITREEIKRESVNQLEDESSAHPQAAQLDVANKVPDKSVRGASVIQDIPTSYDRDEKVVIPQRSSGATSSKSSTMTEEPAVQHAPTVEPTVQHIPSEKPTVQHNQTEQSSTLHTSAEKPTVQYIPTEKPAVQHIPGNQPSSEHVPTEKHSVRNTLPAEQPTVQYIPAEEPGLARSSAENPSSQGPPLAVLHPKMTLQSAHVSDLREDKLELTIPEKVADILSHSEHSESVDVKPASSQTSSKVREDVTNHDTKQQQKEVEGSQKAHTTSREPDSTIQSAGKIPKEASVAADKSASRISETRKNDSRTSAAKHKKEEADDSDESDGDKDDDESVEEAVGEEVGREDAEDDKESAHDDDSAGVGDDDNEDEPSGVALKFGVGVALVLVAHVVLVRKWNADDGTTVQPAISTQASDTEHGVEEITPELIERRQTLIPQDDLEGSEYSEEEEGEEEEDYDDEEEEEKPQKRETYEDYVTKYRPQEVKRALPAESDEEEDEEEEESEEDEEAARIIGRTLQKSARATHITPEESGTEEEGSEEEEVVPVRRATKSSGEQGYVRADISSKDDLKIREDLDLADAQLEETPEEALNTFMTILKTNPASPRARYGKAQALDRVAEKRHSNSLLQEAIDAYEHVLALGASVPDKLFVQAAERCINRMRFKGQYHTAVHIHKKLIQRFSDDPAHANQLAVTYLMINRLTDAKRILEDTLRRWPNNGFAQVHYGFILKTGDNNNNAAVDYLTRGIATREPGTIDGRFFFHLGDALTRLGRHDEASKVYELGVREGLFLSKYQRSLYNVDRLRAQPWWTPEETSYSKYFKKLQDNWQKIREEGVAVLAHKMFRDEAENLRDVGNWQQFELYARGRRIATNCGKAPFTCQLISEFPAARDCRRGQAKFSVMHTGTHVWPHCGPTNCRLRSHLGLVVPQGTYIRVAEETRTWEEGKLFIFDDSFEHEVWHNGTTVRLVLIVDVWHPELTEEEKKSMPAI